MDLMRRSVHFKVNQCTQELLSIPASGPTQVLMSNSITRFQQQARPLQSSDRWARKEGEHEKEGFLGSKKVKIPAWLQASGAVETMPALTHQPRVGGQSLLSASAMTFPCWRTGTGGDKLPRGSRMGPCAQKVAGKLASCLSGWLRSTEHPMLS